MARPGAIKIVKGYKDVASNKFHTEENRFAERQFAVVYRIEV